MMVGRGGHGGWRMTEWEIREYSAGAYWRGRRSAPAGVRIGLVWAPEIPEEIGRELAPKLPGLLGRHVDGAVVDFGECVTLTWLRTSLATMAGALGACL